MRLLVIIYSLILLFIISCSKKSESDIFDAAMALEDPAHRIEALTDFLKQFPETDQKNRALYRLFSDYCGQGNSEQALNYAYNYISQFPPDGRMRVYNSVAWKLAEDGVGTDSAVAYAHRALKLAEQLDARLQNMILDTYAFALYKNGQPAAAREAQRKAMAENADNPDFLGRMADYQFESGQKEEGIRSLLKSLLYSGQTDGYQKLDKWLHELESGAQQRNFMKQEMVNEEINTYLKNENTPGTQSRSAVMLAFSGTEENRALEWALSALQKKQDDASVSERAMLIKNLARVYEARGEFEKTRDILNEIRSYIPAFDFEFWLSLGRAFEKTGQKEEALNAYIAGLIWRKNNLLLEAARALLLEGESIDKKIALARASELNFHPGKFDEKSIETNRVVLAELFTGAECPPCVAADLAFDHLAEYFSRDRVLILEHHLHIPGPDPLTNKMSESRYSFYGADFGTPTVFINGTQKLVEGGPDIAQRVKFYEYRDEIKKFFNKPSELMMHLSADREGDLVSVKISVEPGIDVRSAVRVHTALIERSIDYKGANGIEKHAFVVRYLVNGSNGQILAPDQGNGKVSAEINLRQVEQEIKTYLDDFIKNPPLRYRGFKAWRARPDKLDRDNLAIVSWIQDNNSKEILQAIYQDL